VAAMTTVGAEQARRDLAELLRRAGRAKERIVISVRGEDLAALVSIQDLATLERLEDVLDALEAERVLARVDAGAEPTYSLAEVDEALGLAG
jgi:prevent-host-death family protein